MKTKTSPELKPKINSFLQRLEQAETEDVEAQQKDNLESETTPATDKATDSANALSVQGSCLHQPGNAHEANEVWKSKYEKVKAKRKYFTLRSQLAQ